MPHAIRACRPSEAIELVLADREGWQRSENFNLEGLTLKMLADVHLMGVSKLNHSRSKGANRDREQDFFAKVVEFRAAEVKAVAYGENVIISEWFVDYTHSEWGKVTHDQVSVQRWQDGKVVHERFYYAT
jgi:hypothetical protein